MLESATKKETALKSRATEAEKKASTMADQRDVAMEENQDQAREINKLKQETERLKSTKSNVDTTDVEDTLDGEQKSNDALEKQNEQLKAHLEVAKQKAQNDEQSYEAVFKQNTELTSKVQRLETERDDLHEAKSEPRAKSAAASSFNSGRNIFDYTPPIVRPSTSGATAPPPFPFNFPVKTKDEELKQSEKDTGATKSPMKLFEAPASASSAPAFQFGAQSMQQSPMPTGFAPALAKLHVSTPKIQLLRPSVIMCSAVQHRRQSP